MAQQPSRRAAPHLSRGISDHLAVWDGFAAQGGSSDEEENRAMEVEFDQEAARRRKSSIVLQERPEIPKRQQSVRSNSQCFVHKLVERTSVGDQPKVENKLDGTLESIQETADGVNENRNGSSPSEEPRATHSRLLTKKQLSEMALNVRNMAKKLSSVKVKLNIRSIFLLTKAHDQSLITKTRELTEWLLSEERGILYTVYVEDTMRENKAFSADSLLKDNPHFKDRLKYWNSELAKKRPHTFDFCILLGGDGTVLYSSWLFQRVVPPVLSFAMGSLGFLTKFDFNQYQSTLEKVFRDGVTISLRLRFEGTVMRSQKEYAENESRDVVEELIGEEAGDTRTHKPGSTFEILNDIVVDRGPNPTMSTIELLGDGDHLTTVQADGICVATPTGSTAYNLAAGGSLCHPENPVILVTAICAHTLSFRPIVLPDTMVLRLAVPYDARSSSWASFDGRERVELSPGDYVTISASRYPFAHVMPPGRRSEDWVNSISRTLQWNSRQRQKALDQEGEDTQDKKKL